ncbi:ribonuclease HII [Verrucomicrobiota bacterium sgz303538]
MKCSLRHENALRATGCEIIAGVDEAGRGPLAGPVVVAAVVLPARFRHKVLTDSKQLTERVREELYAELTCRTDVTWTIAIAEREEIDRINILRATHEAMRRAVAALSLTPHHVLIDGTPVRPFPLPQTALVKGDAKSFSIAAASVIAKVTRDRIMMEMDVQFPGYEFSRHKGYGTPLHLERLRLHGPCEIHRRSFLPVRQTLLPLG